VPAIPGPRPDDSRATAGPTDTACRPDGSAAPRYALGGLIARGGMGEVYAARDTLLNRDVAVKVLTPRLVGTTAERRFREEGQITGQLQHPGVPPVYDAGVLPDGRPFLALKLIKGRTLDALVTADGPGGRWLPAFEQVCQAVAYAHAHGVIHRDLKPANVMVGAFGEVQVLDWGLAKVRADAWADRPVDAGPFTEILSPRAADGHTRDGLTLGTPSFMAPEQAIGAMSEVTARTDVFGLGAVLCWLLTGRPPYLAADALSTRLLAARARLDEAFARLDASGADPAWVALCKRCLAGWRDDRPADAGEVAAAVAALRSAADTRGRRDEWSAAAGRVRAAEWRKRRRLAAGGGAVLVAGLVGWAVAGDQWRRAGRERAAADAARRAAADAGRERDDAVAAADADRERAWAADGRPPPAARPRPRPPTPSVG
jgi:tRNA A-37 threonylcarbamoyl transferase component Bud32